MSRCQATTAKGARCRNEAAAGSDFCGVHREATGDGDPARGDFIESLGEGTRTVLGLALAGGITYFAMRFGRRF